MELSKEEQEAIEYLKNIKNWWRKNSPDRIYAINKTDIEKLDILLNLIEKIQKENKLLKDQKEYVIDEYGETIEKQSKVIDELKNKLEKHIKFCEQESSGHINNNVCHISLKFDKSLLEIINRKVEEDVKN